MIKKIDTFDNISVTHNYRYITSKPIKFKSKIEVDMHVHSNCSHIKIKTLTTILWKYVRSIYV